MTDTPPNGQTGIDFNVDKCVAHIKRKIPREYQKEYSKRLDTAIANAPSNESDLAYVLDSLLSNPLTMIMPGDNSPNPYIARYMDFALYHLQNTKMEQDSTVGALRAAGTLSHICHYLINKQNGISSKLGQSSVYGKVAKEILEVYNVHKEDRDKIPDLIEMGNFLAYNYRHLSLGKRDLQLEGIRKSLMHRTETAVNWMLGRESDPYTPALVREIWETAKAEYVR